MLLFQSNNYPNFILNKKVNLTAKIPPWDTTNQEHGATPVVKDTLHLSLMKQELAYA